MERMCLSCKVTIRPESAYCHQCGRILDSEETRQGKVYLTTSLVLVVLLPLAQLILLAITSFALIREVPLIYLTSVIPLLMTIPFYLFTYTGHSWARIPIGLILIFYGLVRMASVFLPLFASLAIPHIIWGTVLVILGIAIIRSRRVKAYIDYRAQSRLG